MRLYSSANHLYPEPSPWPLWISTIVDHEGQGSIYFWNIRGGGGGPNNSKHGLVGGGGGGWGGAIFWDKHPTLTLVWRGQTILTLLTIREPAPPIRIAIAAAYYVSSRSHLRFYTSLSCSFQLQLLSLSWIWLNDRRWIHVLPPWTATLAVIVQQQQLAGVGCIAGLEVGTGKWEARNWKRGNGNQIGSRNAHKLRYL